MSSERTLFQSKAVTAALVVVAALTLGVAACMSRPPDRDPERPKECAAAAQIVARGRPTDDEDWAWKLIRECGAPGSVALAQAWRMQHVQKDTVPVSRVYWRIRMHHDSALFVAAEALLMDSAASQVSRAFSAMLLIAQISDSLAPSYGYFTAPAPYGPCDVSLDRGRAHSYGILLPRQARERVRRLGDSVSMDSSVAAVIRNAARCMSSTLGREDRAAAYARALNATALPAILAEFRRIDTLRDVDAMVRLDERIRAVVKRYNEGELAPQGVAVRAIGTRFPAAYDAFGVNTAPFDSEFIVYSGMLLRLAHRAAPTSPHRSRTLISTLFPGEYGEDAIDGLPQLDSARAYLREFPRGPFASTAASHLAWVHDDIFSVMTDTAQARDYLTGVCYAALLTKAPARVQAAAARDSALKYYARLLELNSDDAEARRRIAELRAGKTSGAWHYCPD